MKINITVDCTPEEARAYMGLPDLRPLQDAVMGELQKQMLDATHALAPEAILRAWMPLAPQTPEHLRDVMTGMLRLFVPGLPAGAGGGDTVPGGGKG
jgi:hypothetical protein